MASSDTRTTAHEITVAAPAKTVFDLIADAAKWPMIFPPTVHVDYLERGESAERLQIWATGNGEVRKWQSRRELDHDRLRVTFHQEVSQHPLLSMAGAWLIAALPGKRTHVRLTHEFRVVGNEPRNAAWVERAVDRNSTAELAALKAEAEREDAEELLLTFDDTVVVPAERGDVYKFLHDAGQWTERIPHVVGVVLTEESPNIQTLEMNTLAADGSTHTTKSVRVCFPDDRIVYKQLQAPGIMTAHTGQWRLTGTGEQTVVTATHNARLDRLAIPTLLGRDATVAGARQLVRTSLGDNSTATIRLAGEHLARLRNA
jgi:ribosome-associated toxin RatA of RatAB toxin-antitoxin module